MRSPVKASTLTVNPAMKRVLDKGAVKERQSACFPHDASGEWTSTKCCFKCNNSPFLGNKISQPELQRKRNGPRTVKAVEKDKNNRETTAVKKVILFQDCGGRGIFIQGKLAERVWVTAVRS